MHVKVENINFSYTELPVLQNVSFQIQSGTITGLIGSNGSGKTTMLKIMIKKLTKALYPLCQIRIIRLHLCRIHLYIMKSLPFWNICSL